MAKHSKRNKLHATIYLVVAGYRKTVYLNGGATRRKAIKCFMNEWSTKKGAGSTWRWWYRAGYRVTAFRITEV